MVELAQSKMCFVMTTVGRFVTWFVAVGKGLIKQKLLVAPEFITDIDVDNDENLKTDQRIEDLSSCPRLQ